MSWRKLNYLVPNPECDTIDDAVTEWRDARPQPTQAEIDAVDMADVIAEEDRVRDESFEIDNRWTIVAKAFHNHENRIRALEGNPSVTLRQVVQALKNL